MNKKHIKRLHEGICDRDLGTPFMDICYNLEKIIDECDQVALNMLPFTGYGTNKQEASGDDHSEMTEAQIRNLYKDKYKALLEK